MNPIGAIEVGGTKTVCAIVTRDGELLARTQFPTASPTATFNQAVDFLSAESAKLGELSGIGVANFGPINVCRSSPEYGTLGATPKPGWAGSSVLGELQSLTALPIDIDTDVNGALLGESAWGAARGLDNVVYVTVGTGIGAGVMVGGQLLQGASHPEIGHLLLPRMEDDRDFAGTCPYHQGRCAEGLAAGPAMAARWTSDAAALPPSHAAWDLEARYLAVLCANLVLTVSPQRIILGGGVMHQQQLFPLIRERLTEYLAGYVDLSVFSKTMQDFIVAPALGDDAGVLGASRIVLRSG